MKVADTSKKGRASMTPPRSTMSLYATPEHKSAARMLGYALTISDADIWVKTSGVWAVRLAPCERVAIAWSALSTLRLEDAESAVRAALGDFAPPIPEFDDLVAEAGFWADCAPPELLPIYAVACFHRMSSRLRADFADFVRRADG